MRARSASAIAPTARSSRPRPSASMCAAPRPISGCSAAPPRIYVKVGDSGNRRQQAFCAECGSNIYATSDEPPGNRMIGLRVGTLDERRELTPTRQFWCRSAMPWLPDLPGEAVDRQ